MKVFLSFFFTFLSWKIEGNIIRKKAIKKEKLAHSINPHDTEYLPIEFEIFFFLRLNFS